ncbi:flagellin N-terminal helical domain-containing protein [Exiguobacterium sp. USCH10]|jgi:flagellin|uniref:flagellin N-terminal helical domain-containing protein n=1 Tax=Exiguobacterium sp. USCH10 TaxID=3024839 RepID=UPI0030A8B93F
MIINHNLNSMNAHRNMSFNTTQTGKAMEKLSSGLRINRAGDDAAGLAISEKMRGQIRGLDQATRNSQDGISMIQTAEGALNETHSILQRMRELSVQAANDTNNADDRVEIQKEVNQLTSEINRIGNTTEFNTQKLLNGNKVGVAATAPSAEVKSSLDIGALKIESKLTGVAGDSQSVEIIQGSGTSVATSAAYSGNKLTITLGTDGSGNPLTVDNDDIIAAIGTDPASDAAFTVTTTDGTQVRGTASVASLTGGADEVTAAKDGAASLQIGANQSQQFTVTINDMRAAALGIAGTAAGSPSGAAAATGAAFTANTAENALSDFTTGTERALDVTDATKASAATKVLDHAIKTVSAERSRLGAYQNRLEHTINNLSVGAENLQAAESRIRDVDMAKEMMNFTKNNILNQAAQAMMSQSNQQPQAVLQLLR